MRTLGAVMLAVAIAAAIPAQAAVERRIERVDEVFDAYRAGARLLVSGDVGLGDGQRQRLLAALAERPNWVVYVAADSRSQEFTNAAGEDLRGFEAVEHALGSLYNRTPFGELRDVSSGETDGCIFALTLADRGMSLYLGDSYKAAGLDADDPALIAKARTALQRGLRVADAVIGTLETVDDGKRAARQRAAVAANVAAERAAAQRQSAERRRALAPFALPAVGLVSMGVWLGLVRLLSRRSRNEARARLARWRGEFLGHQAELVELRKWGEILASNPRYSGETDALADSVVDDVRHVFAIRASALDTLEAAAQLVEPKTLGGKLVNLLWARNYRRAVQRLSDEPIPFDPTTALGHVVAGGDAKADDPLWRGIREIERSTRTFDELIKELDERATRADAAIRHITKSARVAGSALDVLAARIAQLQALDTADGSAAVTAALPALRQTLLPALAQRLAGARSEAESDPVAAVRLVDDCERRIQAVMDLVAVMRTAAERDIPQARRAEADLRDNGVEAAWIDAALRQTAATADAFVEELAGASPPAAAPDVAALLAIVVARSSRAVELDRRRTQAVDVDRADALTRVQLARQEIATRLKLTPQEILVEPDADPGVLLTTAERAAEQARAALAGGDLDAVERHLDAARKAIEEARAIVEETRRELARYGGTVEHLRARHKVSCSEDLPRQRLALESLRGSYDVAALSQAPPDGDTTIADNVEQAGSHLADGLRLCDEADALFAEGGILRAAHALQRATAFFDLADLRLGEITQRAAELARVEVANKAGIADLQQISADLQRHVQQPFVTRRTQELAATAASQLATLPTAGGRERRNPFVFAGQLDAVRQALLEVRRRLGVDQEAYAEVRRSLAMAEQMIEQARAASAVASGDAVADSATIEQQRRALADLERDLRGLQHGAAQPHGEWSDLDRAADRIHAEAAACSATLRHEIEVGSAALAVVDRAGARTREAREADGSLGSPGKSSYVRAKESLQQGDYAQAQRFAEAAIEAADDALAALRRRRQQIGPMDAGHGPGWLQVAAVAAELLQAATGSWSDSRSRRRSPFGGGSSGRSVITPPSVSWPRSSSGGGSRSSSGSGFGKTHSW